MKRQLLYKELAKYYDLIYAFKDYKKETAQIRKLVSKYKKSKGRELLDVACGTGHHLGYLKDEFSCTGVDISKEILEIARENNKGITFEHGNMITMDLGKRFDVVTCLFSSIGYVKTHSNLERTIQNFAKHLKKGGLMLIEPWFTKQAYIPGSPHMETHDGKDIKIARLSVPRAKGNLAVIDMHYLIAERDEEVKYFLDRHELGLFEVDETLKIMKKTGFQSKFLKRGLMRGRGIFVGVLG